MNMSDTHCVLAKPTSTFPWRKVAFVISAIGTGFAFNKFLASHAEEKEADKSKQREHVLFPFKLPMNTSGQRVLLLISEPGDECKYFGPILLKLIQSGTAKVFLLCLTERTDDTKERDWEQFWLSCKKLGVTQSNIFVKHIQYVRYTGESQVVSENRMKDDCILNMVLSLGITSLITFDRLGINGHPKHRTMHLSIAALSFLQLLPKDCRVFVLESVPCDRQRRGLFDIFATALRSPYWCISGFSNAELMKNAALEYKNNLEQEYEEDEDVRIQPFWSRYSFINSLCEMTSDDFVAEIERFGMVV